MLNKTVPDVVLLDLQMPIMSGYEVFNILTRDFPALKVIILTVQYEEQLANHFLARGASGALGKDTAVETIVRTIENCTSKIATVQPSHNLSIRQKEILVMIANGIPHKCIASELNISERTVEYHKNKICQKLRIRSNAELAKFAFKNGFLR